MFNQKLLQQRVFNLILLYRNPNNLLHPDQVHSLLLPCLSINALEIYLFRYFCLQCQKYLKSILNIINLKEIFYIILYDFKQKLTNYILF